MKRLRVNISSTGILSKEYSVNFIVILRLIDFAHEVFQLMMFFSLIIEVYGIIGISKIEFFRFSCTERVKDYDLFKRRNYIQNKVSNSIKRELDYEPIYNKIFLKTKARSYGDEVKEFQARKIPEAGSSYTCWSIMLIDSILKNEEN